MRATQNASFGTRITGHQTLGKQHGSWPGAIPARRESRTAAAALSTRAALQDALGPIGTDTAARSSRESEPLPSTRTNCRCTDADRLQMENTRTAESVSANRRPIAQDEILPARHTISGRDAPSTAQTKCPTLWAPRNPQFRGPRSPFAPIPTREDTVASTR